METRAEAMMTREVMKGMKEEEMKGEAMIQV